MVEDFAFEVFVPGSPGSFQQVECADDVRVEKIAWVFDGAVNVGFGGEVDDVGWLEFGDGFGYGFGVGEVDAAKLIVGVIGDCF